MGTRTVRSKAGRRARLEAERDEIVAGLEATGWRVEVVEYVECADAPGLLGSRAGLTMPTSRRVRVSTKMTVTLGRFVAVLRHEREHARAIDRNEPPSWHEEFDEAEGALPHVLAPRRKA